MKFPFWALFAATIFLAACSGSGDSFDFVSLHKPGETGYYSLKQTSKYTETDSTGFSEIVEGLHEMTVADEVVKVNADGSVLFDVRYQKIHSTFEITGKGKFEADSDVEGPSPMNAELARMKRQKIQVLQDRKGHVLSVTGADTLFYKMFVDSLYNGNNALKEILEAEAFFPDHPVKKGESWTRTHSKSNYYPVIFNDTLTFTGIKDSLLRVELRSNIVPNPASKAVYDEAGIAIDYVMQGSSKGTYWVNMKNFVPASSSLTLNLKGTKKILSTGKTVPVSYFLSENTVYTKSGGL